MIEKPCGGIYSWETRPIKDVVGVSEIIPITSIEEMWALVLEVVRHSSEREHLGILVRCYDKLMRHVRRDEIKRLEETEASLLAKLKVVKSPQDSDYSRAIGQISLINKYVSTMWEIDYAYVVEILYPMLQEELKAKSA